MTDTHFTKNITAVIMLLVGALVVLLPAGCTNERPDPTLPGAHPSSWMNKSSSDFHGQFVYHAGTSTCEHCHGIDTPGGESGVSCLDCHGPGQSDCTRCHGGTDNNTGAPPLGLRGETADSTRAVGAHTAHLTGSSLADAVLCNTCHVVPLYMLSPEHLDRQGSSSQPPDSIAEITWHGIADPGGAVWDRGSRTCSNTYCHGNFSGGNSANAPVWSGANQAQCGSCHDAGSDPSQLAWPRHPYHINNAGLTCGDCHASVVDTLLNITGPALHVNGLVDTLTRDPAVCAVCHGTGPQTCTGCHGGTDNQTGAPPRGLNGELATTDLAVGAHTTHMEGAALADAFLCSDCHAVPATMTTPGHLDGDDVAELTWSTLAGAVSSWNRTSATCSNTYCHGNFSGGNAASPVWTGSDQATCGSCHDVGSDPTRLGWIHPYHISQAGLVCGDCHASVTDLTLNIIDKSLHVNGQVETQTRDQATCDRCHGTGPETCVQCHGGRDNQTGAPPRGLGGETATTDLAVGAHTTHMEGALFADGFACSDCHKVPSTMLEFGHLGVDSTAEMTFSSFAGPSAAWRRLSRTCTGTYCHGNFAGGDANNAPVWTASDQAACGSCHDVGSNPGRLAWPRHAYHINNAGLSCGDCHASVVDMSLNVIDRTLHVNGLVDTLTRDPSACQICHGTGPQTCTGCHGGTDNNSGAPPRGLDGEISTTLLAVGAHTIHMEGGLQADGFVCSDCHAVPATTVTPGHLDGDDVAEITWSAFAGVSSSWNRATATCSNTYCHGNFSGGRATNQPLWTGSGQGHCGSCHDIGIDPQELGGRHQKHVAGENLDCVECHASVVNAAFDIIDLSKHVNRTNDVSFLRGGNYNPVGKSCSSLSSGACHGSEGWN